MTGIWPTSKSVDACSPRRRKAAGVSPRPSRRWISASRLSRSVNLAGCTVTRLADLLAISSIGVLSTVTGSLKFEAAAEVLRDRCKEVDLRIETEGPRTGMWSVSQPQWVTQVRRVG